MSRKEINETLDRLCGVSGGRLEEMSSSGAVKVLGADMNRAYEAATPKDGDWPFEVAAGMAVETVLDAVAQMSLSPMDRTTLLKRIALYMREEI